MLVDLEALEQHVRKVQDIIRILNISRTTTFFRAEIVWICTNLVRSGQSFLALDPYFWGAKYDKPKILTERNRILCLSSFV